MSALGTDPPPDLSFLSGTAVFGGLADESLRVVAGHLERRVLPGGTLVVSEGEGAREMFVLERGEVEVFIHRSHVEEGELLLATMARGDCFGEMSLLDIQSRSATVRTRTETSLLVLPYRKLLAVRKADEEAFVMLMLNVAREVSRRLRACEKRLLQALSHESHDVELTQEIFGSPRE